MIRPRHSAGLLVLFGLALFSGCRTTSQPTPSDLPRDGAALIAEVARLAQEAVVARQTAAMALENALAAQDKAEARLLVSFREHGCEEVTLAKTRLATAAGAAERTLAAVDEVVTLALEVVKATSDIPRQTEDPSQTVSENLRQCVLSSRRLVAAASLIAEDLKREWLVADLSGEPEEEKASAKER